MQWNYLKNAVTPAPSRFGANRSQNSSTDASARGNYVGGPLFGAMV
jgi:hypothetical protein